MATNIAAGARLVCAFPPRARKRTEQVDTVDPSMMLSSACMFVNVATPGTALQHRTKNPRLFWLPAALVGSDDFCLSPPPRLDSKGTRMMMMAGLMAYLFPRQRQGRHSVRKQSTSIFRLFFPLLLLS